MWEIQMAKTMTILFTKTGATWANSDAAISAIEDPSSGAFADNKPRELIDEDIAAGKATREHTLISPSSLRVVTVWANDADFNNFIERKDALYSGSRSAINGFGYDMTVATS
tara:strand:+ start:916 stop:1251 length:336 start_codon:yes stop_codon:yes gene_type:complete